MTIAVLVKQVPDTAVSRVMDPEGKVLDRTATEAVADEINERALAVALELREQVGGDVVVLTMGPEKAAEVLRRCLAVGADAAVHLLDDGLVGADTVQTACVLSAALERIGPDVVIAGCESTDGRSGVLPAMIAEVTGWGQATFLDAVSWEDGTIHGNRVDEAGTRPVVAQLPCVLSITEAAAEPKYPNLRGIMAAKKKPLAVWDIAELGLDSGRAEPVSEVLDITPRPARAAGLIMVDDGSAGLDIAAFLKEIEAL